MRRVAVVGTRDDEGCAQQAAAYATSLPKGTVVVTGGWWDEDTKAIRPTRGVDRAAAQAAAKRGLIVVLVAGSPVDGVLAGVIRNPVVVEVAEGVKAFWNGRSSGTERTMRLARAAGKLL